MSRLVIFFFTWLVLASFRAPARDHSREATVLPAGGSLPIPSLLLTVWLRGRMPICRYCRAAWLFRPEHALCGGSCGRLNLLDSGPSGQRFWRCGYGRGKDCVARSQRFKKIISYLNKNRSAAALRHKFGRTRRLFRPQQREGSNEHSIER